MDRKELEARVRADCPTIAAGVLGRINPCATIRARRAAESEIPVGATKFGGSADLPPGLEWPRWSDERGSAPLDLVAQINLAEIEPGALTPSFPTRGLLSFFYDVDAMPGGFQAGDESGSRVLFTPEASGLTRIKPPIAREFSLATCRAEIETGYSIPSIWQAIGNGADIPKQEADAYFDLRAEVCNASAQLLGHADEIQHPIEEEAVQFKYGCFKASKFDHELWEHVKHHVSEWQLLLQVDSDNELDAMWGDMGRIYYAIRTHDLEALNFDETMLVFQCS